MARAKKKTLGEQLAEGSLSLKPTQRLLSDAAGERIVEKSLRELVVEGIIEVGPTQKILGKGEGARVVDKTAEELLAEGLERPQALIAQGRVTVEQVKESVLRRLRRETAARFAEHRTPGGYRLDDLARQKATASVPFRHLSASEEPKKGLLAARLIYPDAVLDEILAGVSAIQATYQAAKTALTTAVEKGAPVEKWAAITLTEHLPTAAPKSRQVAPKSRQAAAKPARKAPKKKPAGPKKGGRK